MNKQEVAAYIRVTEKILDRMVAEGRFPRPIPRSARSEDIWTGQDVAAWLLIAPRMVADGEESKNLPPREPDGKNS